MRLHRFALTAVLAVSGAALTGCADDLDDRALAPALEPEVPDVRGPSDLDDPYQGVFDVRFAEDLPAYAGQEVTVLATVAEALAPRAFTVTSPDGSEVEPVLVVTTGQAGEVEAEAGDDLVVAATPLREFDAEVVVEELGLGVDPVELEDWEDETFLVATVVEPAP